MTLQIQNDLGVKSNMTAPQIAQVKTDLGLNNVDNTSDINKPVSTPVAQAIADAFAACLAQAKAYTDSVVGSVPASVATQPTGAALTAGQTLSLSMVGAGSSPLTYQWEKSPNGTDSWAPVSGATGATYSKTSVTGDTGYYRGSVDNAYGPPAYTNVVQVTVVAADVTAPVASSAVVQNASPTIVSITFNEAMNTGVTPATSAFAVSGHTVTGVAWGTSTRLDITVTGAFVNGEAARTAAYTQPGSNQLRDAAGNLCASFSGLAITNNVAAADTTAPTVSSAQVADNDRDTIVITYNETLDASSVPATSAFSVSGGKTVTSVSVSGTNVLVGVNSDYAAGDTITVSYTVPGSNRIRDVAGNNAAALSNNAVTNNIVSGGAFSLTTGIWEAPTEGTPFTAVILYLSRTSGVYAQINDANTQYRSLSAGVTSATVSLPNAGPWFYRVAYVNAGGEGIPGIENPAITAT